MFRIAVLGKSIWESNDDDDDCDEDGVICGVAVVAVAGVVAIAVVAVTGVIAVTLLLLFWSYSC